MKLCTCVSLSSSWTQGGAWVFVPITDAPRKGHKREGLLRLGPCFPLLRGWEVWGTVQRCPSLFSALYNQKKQAGLPKQRFNPVNSHTAIKFHILLPQLHMPRQKKQQEDLFNIYSQVFFLISSETNTNALWSLHSAGANPPLEASGNLIPSCGCNLSTQAFLQAPRKGPQWMERLALAALLHL